MPEMTREWTEVVDFEDGQEYECAYAAGPSIPVDYLVLAKKVTQLYRWSPYVGWQATGFPELEHDLAPMELRNGEFVDMREDPGFVMLVKRG